MKKMDIHTSGRLVLAGDIGGTKTNLGLFGLKDGKPIIVAMESYPSQDAGCLEDLIGLFLKKRGQPIAGACFGIAGPVIDGVSKTTNLPWIVSESSIKDRFQWEKVRLVNDLVATANSIPLLEKDELSQLNHGVPDPQGNMGLVAPGTGLGVALMVSKDNRLHPISSEGGHVDFAPTNDKEVDLLKYLQGRWGHVSVERVAAGPGLFTIYEWLRESRQHQEPSWLTERLKNEDASRVISDVGLTNQDPMCVEALDMFVSIIGATAGNLALTGFTTGGMYLGGGISPKILSKLKEPIFLRAFSDKGRFKDLLLRMPILVILNDKAALLGAAHCAFDAS